MGDLAHVLGVHAPSCSRAQNVGQSVAFLENGNEGFRLHRVIHSAGYEVAQALAPLGSGH